MPRIKKDEKFAENPFVDSAIIHTVTGTRMVYTNPIGDKDTFACVNTSTGEMREIQDISFGKRIVVDKTRFLKVYADGVRMFLNLSSAGVKVFMIIYQLLVDDPSKDPHASEKVVLNYEFLANEIKGAISKATFYRGIRELKKAKLIAPTLVDGLYWVNIDYIFKGDRLTLVNQYILDKQEKLKTQTSNIYPENWGELYHKWKSKEITALEFMNASGLPKGTFYHLVKDYEMNTSHD